MTSQQPAPVIRTYVAESYEAAIRDFEADARVMAESGYQPASQTWVPDEAGRGCFWIAVIVVLFVTIIGIILLPFVMGDRKKGTLTVTYTYAAMPSLQAVPATKVEPVAAPASPAAAPSKPEPRSTASSDRPTKVCPDCAEAILEAARICRFCRHEFWPVDAPPPSSGEIDEAQVTAAAPVDRPPTSEATPEHEEGPTAQESQPDPEPPPAEPEALPPQPQPAPAWVPAPPPADPEPQDLRPPAPPPDRPPAPPPYAPQQPPYVPQQPTNPPPPPGWQRPSQGQPPGQVPPGQGPGAWGPPPPTRPPDRPR